MSPHTLTVTLVGIGIGVLVAITTGVLAAARAPVWWAPAVAVVRGTLQLAGIALILRGVITDVRWVLVALAVMFTVAAVTASRRLGRGHMVLVTAAMAAGVAVTVGVVFLTGAIDSSARYALAIGGIIIGNSMTVATLTGRRLLSGIDDRWEEVEAWLALGATRRQSTLRIARDAIHQALIPSTDQTKTTGLVTLPRRIRRGDLRRRVPAGGRTVPDRRPRRHHGRRRRHRGPTDPRARPGTDPAHAAQMSHRSTRHAPWPAEIPHTPHPADPCCSPGRHHTAGPGAGREGPWWLLRSGTLNQPRYQKGSR